MKIHKSSEDYLERILILQKENGQVISLDIANSMNYSKASISRAMKKLRENNYIKIDTNGIITLTDSGYNVAQRMYERHTLLSNFFIVLGVPQDIALDDACKIEHDLSDITFEAIKNHVLKNEK